MGKVGFAPFTLDKHEYLRTHHHHHHPHHHLQRRRGNVLQSLHSQLELLVRLHGAAAAAAAVTVAGDDLPSIYAYSP